MDFDYKKYSLEKLETWVRDALTSAEATPQEIYDTIKGVVDEEYHYFKHNTSRCYDLLSLLNGNGNEFLRQVKSHGELWDKEDIEAILGERKYCDGVKLTCDKDDKSPECQQAWNSFWEENYYPEEHKVEDIMPPWGHSDMEALRYSEEELNAMCEKAASDQEKEKCREYNLREAEYYDKRAQLDSEHSKYYYDYARNDINRQNPFTPKQNKHWVLPVEVVKDEDTDKDEYCIAFPNDLLEAANLKEGDEIEWIDRGDGSWTIQKTKQTTMHHPV
jgi:hypothetical protein